MDKEIISYLNSLKWPALVVIIVGIALWKPENFKLWGSWIWYFLSKILFKSLRRKAVASGIESRCTSAIKKISKESPYLNLPDLNIKWANESNIETILKEGKAIVKLNYTANHTKNTVTAIFEYIKHAVLNRTKPYLDNSLNSAIDFSLTKKILLSIKKYQKNYVSLFLKENPITDAAVRQKCSILEEIDDTGLFTRVVLKELDDFGDKLTGRMPIDEYNNEAHDFLNFIYTIAIRENDEQTPLLFQSRFINVSVILVAKSETFLSLGVSPYLRRIKLSLSKGVEDYYLLARNDKVDILKQVAKQLLQTGYFIQEHKAQEYKDNLKRNVICYYFKINKDGLLSRSIREIQEAKENGTILNGIITKVASDYLKVDVNGIEGIVYKENISTIPIQNISTFFEIDELVELSVAKVLEDGTTEFSIKETKSDPNILLNEKLSIGKEVAGIIRYIDDDFMRVELRDYKIDGISFRDSLTFSKYVFLNEKYKINEEHTFKIIGYDVDRGRVKLQDINLKDPWTDFHANPGDLVDFKVMKKISKGYIGEIREGIEAILYDEELTWLPNEIENEKSKIRLSDICKCRILKTNYDRKIIIVSKKISESPIENFFNSNKGKIFDFVITTVNDFGITGFIENKWQIYIPKYLQSWSDNRYHYIVGRKYKVAIKGLHNSKERLIGSFKEVLPHPLEPFKQKFPEGSILGKCRIKTSHEWGYIIEIRVNAKQSVETFLFKGELTDKTRVYSSEQIFSEGDLVPLMVKQIDYERNRVAMSLKNVFEANRQKIDNLNYEDSYNAIVAANKGRNYVVFIVGYWLDGILETDNIYRVGEKIMIRPIRLDKENLLLTDN